MLTDTLHLDTKKQANSRNLMKKTIHQDKYEDEQEGKWSERTPSTDAKQLQNDREFTVFHAIFSIKQKRADDTSYLAGLSFLKTEHQRRGM